MSLVPLDTRPKLLPFNFCSFVKVDPTNLSLLFINWFIVEFFFFFFLIVEKNKNYRNELVGYYKRYYSLLLKRRYFWVLGFSPISNPYQWDTLSRNLDKWGVATPCDKRLGIIINKMDDFIFWSSYSQSQTCCWNS